MNSIGLADSPTCLQAFQKYLSRIFQTCFGWLPCFRRKNLVHPVKTESGNNVFFKLDSHRRIRVIHIDVNKEVPATNDVSQKTKTINWNTNQYASKPRSYSTTSDTSENSLDEYWFTRWSRPLRLSDNCNCSFRQKWRASLRGSKVLHSLPQLRDAVHYDTSKEALHLPSAVGIINAEKATIGLPSSMDKNDCVNIENFAVDFVKDILIEAISYLESNINRPTFDTRNYNTNTHGPNLKQCSTITGLLKTNRYTTDSELADSIAISCSSPILQRINNTLTLNHDSVVDSVQLDFKDNILNTNIGCINPAFLDNSSDPDVILTAQLPARKVCKHVKRITKPLLYFLHSVGSSADIWQSMLNYFVSTGFEVVAPDLLGHGFSSTPDQASAYTFQRLLKDAVDIFDRFVGEHGRCVVIGHAYGLAAAVARYRTQVTHLVLISGGGPTPLAPIHETALFPCLQGCLKPIIFCGCKRDAMYAPCGKHMAPCDSLSGSVPKHVLRHVAQGQDWPEGDSTFHRRILVPTLLVHGMLDPHVTLVQECEMERTIPRSFLELIPNAGHLSMLETPGQLSHMVHCFIDWWTR